MEVNTVKKPTRQWDAWTRQEEEKFFNAIRQVGKNFEKITCRVQSKNKDQVRHYYYRVIKRINKLLGPGLVLDARNSKDANAAILSWWSLLEKHSCSASKLHLKPRRFKTFVTALEHQLLKDRKKSRKRKEPSMQPLFIQPASVGTADVSFIGSGTIKLSTCGETRTNRKMGAQRGSPSKRKPLPLKPATIAEGARPPRQRRKVSDVPVSLTALKRWEKAARAGVTLMAEAAEHLEKAAAVEQMASLEPMEPHILQTTKVSSSTWNVEHGTSCRHSSDRHICASEVPCSISLKDAPTTTDNNSRRLSCSRKSGDIKGIPDVDFSLCNGLPVPFRARMLEDIPCSLVPPSSIFTSSGLKALPVPPCKGVEEIPSNTKNCRDPKCQTVGQNPENIASKLKLQLYPIDAFTRQTLEQDGLNPHLELTLKGKKSIASVLQHLISKWGKSSIAAGELRLHPFDAERVDAASCESWNAKDVAITAADVHSMLGSPEVFRLRYGWVSSRVLQTSSAVLQGKHPKSSAIIGSNAVLNLESENALIPMTTLQFRSSMHMNSVEAETRSLCDVADVQKDLPSCLPQASPTPVAGLANSTASPLIMKHSTDHHTSSVLHSGTVEHDSSFHTSRVLHPDTKESILETGVYENKLLAEKSDGREKMWMPSAAVSFGQVSGANGIRTDSIDTQLASCSWLYDGSNDGFAQHLWSNEDSLRSNLGNILHSEVDWVDSFSNISIGELLNHVPHADCSTFKCELHFGEKSDVPCSLESLKAVQPQHFTTETLVLPAQIQQQSSIWGAEDTRDSFSFQRVLCPGSVMNASSLNKASPNPTSMGGHGKESSSVPWRQDNLTSVAGKTILEKPTKEIRNLIKKDVDSFGASQPVPIELYLADSLGALDMCMKNQSEGHQTQDLFLKGDSSLGFSGLIGGLGEGNVDSLLGLPTHYESISMYREDKHSSFLLVEDSKKSQVFQSQP